ncbi:uncharacterized protein [Elaeis guineensis]|uniref:uncharacterized protein isoform X16 n=1 Tax=Elaeis guineensis var. tenera TaxID=51953 RepID=UPI003C6CE2F0
MEMVPELPRRASGEDPDDQLRVPLGSGRHRSSDRHPFDPKKTASTHPPLFQLLRPELGFSISGKPMLQNLSSHMVLVDIKIRHFPKQSVSTKDCRSWLYDGSKMAKPITPCRKIKSSKSIGKGWLSQVRLDLHMMDQLATTGMNTWTITFESDFNCNLNPLNLLLQRLLQMGFSVGLWIYLSFSHTWVLPLGRAWTK